MIHIMNVLHGLPGISRDGGIVSSRCRGSLPGTNGIHLVLGLYGIPTFSEDSMKQYRTLKAPAWPDASPPASLDHRSAMASTLCYDTERPRTAAVRSTPRLSGFQRSEILASSESSTQQTARVTSQNCSESTSSRFREQSYRLLAVIQARYSKTLL